MHIPFEQIPLLQIVDEDVLLLRQDPQNVWFRILENFPWKAYRFLAADYYNALYHFNQTQAYHKEASSMKKRHKNVESKRAARQRLLFKRATLNKESPVLFEQEQPQLKSTVHPLSLAPGVVPRRMAGLEPKCFFALFKSFIGVMLMGLPPEPEYVHLQLTTNPSFARGCGFSPKRGHQTYDQTHVPSVRKLQQFDQIMTTYGLWSKQKIEEIRKNIQSGVIQPESHLVGDTTHYYAYSAFETVPYEVKAGAAFMKKSQSKVTKRCQCQDKTTCEHPWELADDGAGTIVKSGGKMHWGHKACILGLPKQGIPLDAAAVSDAASHDSQTLIPHIKLLYRHLPEVNQWFSTVLYDSACDDQKLKTECYTERFVFGPPTNEFLSCIFCQTCLNQQTCCPNAKKGRTVTIPFDQLPHIDPQDPPMAKRFKALMTRRSAIERIIKRLKCDLSDERLRKRGNPSFQAYLDKTMIAFHLLLRG